ncbi:triple tyrosine motif-containing protein, partial [uncultured Christiangramia sp.]|uniref:helix-turn-helix and ligand-binding sensor domain-containing protein n=1 Tax=uncultured Christiangramia sp. TaxID=503836 RepID=UPI00345AA9CE
FRIQFKFNVFEIQHSRMLFMLILSGLLVCDLQTYAQELPPVTNFSPNDYSAGNQNWMISQADNKNLYFANSTGLLEYNGERWRLYPVPNKSIVRSVKVVKEKIFTGAYMEAGYWTPRNNGELVFQSLISKFPDLNDGEQFWDIEYIDGQVVFRSFAGIYLYDLERDEVTKMANPTGKPVSNIFNFEDELYFQLAGDGLYKFEKGQPRQIITGEQLGDIAIMHLYDLADDGLSIITGNSEFYKIRAGELEQFNIQLSESIGKPNALDALDLSNGNLVLGTVGSGVLEIDRDGKIIGRFDQNNILQNNTTLDLHLDQSGNVWTGLDYGISVIDLGSTFRSFQDNRGKIGSVYDSYKKDDLLYLGTNQGLYVKKDDSEEFQLIPGTNGQVWFLDEIDGNLFCGHNSGTFLVEGATANKISERLGTWIVKKYKEDLYIQGHYNGISFLRKEYSGFEDLPMLNNFPHSSKSIVVAKDLSIWIGNEHKGVFNLQLNDTLSSASKTSNYKFDEESGITSGVFQFNDSLYYSSLTNIYKFDQVENRFDPDNSLNLLVSDVERVSGRMIVEEDDVLWGFSEEGIFSIEPEGVGKDYQLEYIFIDQDYRNIAVGYENITRLNNDRYLLGVANGYVSFNDSATDLNFADFEISIDRITASSIDSLGVSLNSSEEIELPFQRNNLKFEFSAPVFKKYTNTKYSYRLVGLSSNWSAWTEEHEVSYENLNFGDYIFEVKARVGNAETEPVSVPFNVERPFYLSTTAIILYVLIFLLILYAVHLMNRRHHRKYLAENERALKLKNLEAEKEIIKLKNEKLEQDMASKNRELAVTTMSLIKKNEFLTKIKDQLKEYEKTGKVNSVIQTIDKDISEEDNWKFFKKAFSNADKDFFKKIKSKHPELTSNDLKLCAYLRLNLSSKEIAPLLNISVKSVEIKRYRLRKKMNLDRETNLTEYILSL